MASQSRRTFLTHGTFGAAAVSARLALPGGLAAGLGMLGRAEDASAAQDTSVAGGHAIRVTDSAGDRATAYGMTNKIARRDGHLVCTWLDVDRQNRWALVDVARGQVLRSGTLGKPRSDNHCGAALATDVDGTLHLLIGAHHGSFIHYRWPAGRPDWELVQELDAVGQTGTYPSLVCDRDGTLHVVYRMENHGTDAQLMYCRRPRKGPWSAPRSLVRSAVHEHSWLTNAIELGESGRLHAVVSNTQPVPGQGKDARYFGASHLYSDDAGQTWRQLGVAAPLADAADARHLARIEAVDMPAERIEAQYGGPRGPRHSYYHKMVLSNPVVDSQGRPWAIVHNHLAGDAVLYRGEPDGRWIGTALMPPVRALLPGYQIRHFAQLSRHRDGTIVAVLPVSPEADASFGAPGTALVRLLVDAEGRITRSGLVRPAEPTLSNWLASLERWCWHAPFERPALAWTRGLNAGGYDNNVNRVKTEVWIDPQ